MIEDLDIEPCVFCDRIARREFLGWRLGVVWFEPLNPVVPGHMLFVPIDHRGSAAEGPHDAADAMKRAAQYVATERISANIITSIGVPATQSVFHTHIHVVPRVKGDGLALPWTGQVKS